jgi:hypothetical protein
MKIRRAADKDFNSLIRLIAAFRVELTRLRGVERSAEQLAFESGNQPPYNWVHPNNQPIIQFLGRRGYNVLNLIELRQPRSGEKRQNPIQVGDNKFLY